MARISAVVQVGGKHRAGKPEYLSGGIIRACIYGQVRNHWGLLARPGAMYLVSAVRVENGSLDDLRALARAEIDRRDACGDNIFGVRSTQEYAQYYSNTGYCAVTGARLTVAA
jgi:hypothetical protein